MYFRISQARHLKYFYTKEPPPSYQDAVSASEDESLPSYSEAKERERSGMFCCVPDNEETEEESGGAAMRPRERPRVYGDKMERRLDGSEEEEGRGAGRWDTLDKLLLSCALFLTGMVIFFLVMELFFL